jgi:hypothetical protein
MSAHELAEPYPYVSTAAALVLAERRLPALLVVDRDDQPYAIVPGSQLVRRLVPEYAYALADHLPAAGLEGRDLDEVTGRAHRTHGRDGCPPCSNEVESLGKVAASPRTQR